MSKKLAESLEEGGAHHLLGRLAGDWHGTTRTWFMPDELADESPWQGTMRPVMGGRFVSYEYTGAMGDKPLQGMATIGHNLGSGRFEMAWVDTFHMSTAIMLSTGEATADGFSVLGSYPDPSGGPAWGWRTAVQLVSPDQLVITQYNITPDGQEAKAVETTYQRR